MRVVYWRINHTPYFKLMNNEFVAFLESMFLFFKMIKFTFISFLRRLFAVTDDIFCLFQGHIENVAHLKQQYGLGKNANEVIIILEAYRTLRDRGPYPADQVLRDFQGKFSFVLYDGSSKTAFVAAVSFSSLIYYTSCYSFYSCSSVS